MVAILNPQYKKTYTTLYHEVFKPLKSECERLYDAENPHGYMQHKERDEAINELVFTQLTAPREQQTEFTRDLLGRFRQSLGVNEWDHAAKFVPAFIADVRQYGLTAVVQALPRDGRLMNPSSAVGNASLPIQNATTSAAFLSGDKLKDAVKALQLDEALLSKLKKTD
jgi:hypothetical protein